MIRDADECVSGHSGFGAVLGSKKLKAVVKMMGRDAIPEAERKVPVLSSPHLALGRLKELLADCCWSWKGFSLVKRSGHESA